MLTNKEILTREEVMEFLKIGIIACSRRES